MSSAGMLLYILFEKIMLIIDIDQADLHFRWCHSTADQEINGDGGGATSWKKLVVNTHLTEKIQALPVLYLR